jgi:aspartate 1-decarboxylase
MENAVKKGDIVIIKHRISTSSHETREYKATILRANPQMVYVQYHEMLPDWDQPHLPKGYVHRSLICKAEQE